MLFRLEEMEMSKLFKIKSFKNGFVLGIVLSLIIQLFDYVLIILLKRKGLHTFPA